MHSKESGIMVTMISLEENVCCDFSSLLDNIATLFAPAKHPLDLPLIPVFVKKT